MSDQSSASEGSNHHDGLHRGVIDKLVISNLMQCVKIDENERKMKKLEEERYNLNRKFENAVKFGKQHKTNLKNAEFERDWLRNYYLETRGELEMLKKECRSLKEKEKQWQKERAEKEKTNERMARLVQDKEDLRQEIERLQWCKARVEALERPREELEADPSVLRTSLISCKICEFFYNELPERTPRMLACGHTVCEGCGEMLARQCDTYIPRIIKCPFDRKVTVLDNGGVRNLPKNYSILDDIDDHKNDES